MFTAKVYKVMVGSLSGTMEEVYAANETIHKWNLENAERTGKLYMLTDWSMKADNLQDMDGVIGVVGNWIDNTCFIENCIKEGKKVMLFFNTYHDPSNSIPSEQDDITAFRNTMHQRCVCESYNSITELNSMLNERLTLLNET